MTYSTGEKAQIGDRIERISDGEWGWVNKKRKKFIVSSIFCRSGNVQNGVYLNHNEGLYHELSCFKLIKRGSAPKKKYHGYTNLGVK